jgi:hypothetical protein
LIDHAPGGHDDLANAVAGAVLAAAVPVSPFLRRTEQLAAVMRGDRIHPFSPAEPATLDDIEINRAAFDGDTDAPRAVHFVISSAGDAAGLAIGYAKRLRQTVSGFLNESHIVTYGDMLTPPVCRDMAPSIVVEGVLRVVAPPGDEITAEDLVGLIVRLHDEAPVPIRWVTMDRPPSLAALRRLRECHIQTGERSVEGEPAMYQELKSAIYERRIAMYDYPPLVAQLTTMTADDVRPSPLSAAHSARGREAADALAGLVHLLVHRRESWPAPRRSEWPRREVVRM